MKADIDELYVIFLLKKNVQPNIIKIILGYPPIVALETFKEWKVVITSVRQRYEFIEGWHDYKIGTGTIYGGQGLPIDIRKSKYNFKNRKPKCFSCNICEHIVKNY